MLKNNCNEWKAFVALKWNYLRCYFQYFYRVIGSWIKEGAVSCQILSQNWFKLVQKQLMININKSLNQKVCGSKVKNIAVCCIYRGLNSCLTETKSALLPFKWLQYINLTIKFLIFQSTFLNLHFYSKRAVQL